MSQVTRRDAISVLAAMTAVGGSTRALATESANSYKLSTFSVDVTPAIGAPLLAGLSPPVRAIDDPLFAKGWVLTGPASPIVVAAIDWCEIRNDAYDRWRELLAEAAGTDRERVFLSSVHQHDAPLADLAAERILERNKVDARLIDLEFHERCVRSVADAVRKSLAQAQPVTHCGVGKARVEEVASNRRYLGADGAPRHDRMSSMAPGYARDQPEGTIDPWLRMLSFWNGDRPLAATSAYATHPMAFYRTGRVTADFPGMARARRQKDLPEVLQIYVSGASGNVVAGKFNDGSEESRRNLAHPLYDGMVEAWNSTKRYRLEHAEFRSAPVQFKPSLSPALQREALERQLAAGDMPHRAALGLSWLERVASGQGLIIPVLDLGRVQYVLLPGEAYVEFQLLAESMRPDSTVIVAGYGECGPGYVPIERAWTERDANLNDWCWIGPGAEAAMTAAMKEALTP